MSATNCMSAEVVAFLSRRDAYSDGPTHVEIKETHISRVFLSKKYAYKLKKPVRFDFLDFSTLAMRKQACENELQLNRRLAPNVYLGVVPVCRAQNGTFNIGGTGEPVEWLVKMRRLDDARTLLAAIDAGGPSPEQSSSLASRLADFYIGQAPAVVKSEEFTASLLNHIEANRTELLRRLPECAASIAFSYSAQTRFVYLLLQCLTDRVCDGRIVDGHGDLRPEHIYFEKEPIVIDCIEFNDEYRNNDIVDELAFLAMECDRLGCEHLGETILQEYFLASGDQPDASLVAFYKSYRASVRAKVALLRGEQQPAWEDGPRRIDSVLSYLQLAERYSQLLGPRVVLSVGGLMGSGKSTVASYLAEQLRATVLRTDVIRNELYERNGAAGYAEGKYAPEFREHVYATMLDQVESSLASNPTVILDGTFSKHDALERARATADNLQAKWIHVECHCPKEVSLQRIVNRRNSERFASEARPELYDRQVAEYEPCLPTYDTTRIDTTLPLAEQVGPVLQTLRELVGSGMLSRA
ncbi:AAA family ATPase [Planctomycetota bacterium]